MISQFLSKFQYISLFILLIALLYGCESDGGETSSVTMQPDMHNSMIALDWVGAYHGVVPCADCEGIDTKIILTDNFTYHFEQIYLGRSDQVFISEGTFFWSEDGSRIQLNNLINNQTSGTYQVGENLLFQLDIDGYKIEGDLTEHYVLTKMIDDLSDFEWELIELKGTIINFGGERQHSAFLHFISGENRVSGNGGCNQFNGTYIIKSGNRVTFSDVESTKMTCEHMEIEYQLFEALKRADNYTLHHDTLSLNQSDRMNLARFLVLDE